MPCPSFTFGGSHFGMGGEAVACPALFGEVPVGVTVQRETQAACPSYLVRCLLGSPVSVPLLGKICLHKQPLAPKTEGGCLINSGFSIFSGQCNTSRLKDYFCVAVRTPFRVSRDGHGPRCEPKPLQGFLRRPCFLPPRETQRNRRCRAHEQFS